jgi:hypothetical protein
LSRFTSTKVINSRWRNNDFVGEAGSTHTFPDAFHEEFLVDWARQIADGSIVITETPTTGVIQMSSLTVGDITLTGTATGNFGGGSGTYVSKTGDTMSGQLYVSSATTTSTVGFGEIIVAKGTSYGSITVNAADDHIHIRSKNPVEILAQSTSTMQGLRARGLGVNSTHTYPTLIDDGITFGEDANLYRSAANALKTDDALEVVGSLTNGGTSVSLSTHTHAYQPAGTYVTSVAGTAPITASTTTAGIVTVALTATLPPTGSIVMWPTATAPTDWLFLDGSTYNQSTYPALAAVFGVVSGTFTLPDMRDRFAAGASTVSVLANNAGTFAPNTANATAHDHTTNIAHAHANTIAVSDHSDHAHVTDPAATNSGAPSATFILSYSSGVTTATIPTSTHTHSTNIAATTSGFNTTNLTHGVTGGVTSLGTTSVTSSSAGGTLTPKATLLNFIIKT